MAESLSVLVNLVANAMPFRKGIAISCGAMEGTRTPGLPIRRNRAASFVHSCNSQGIVISIEIP